MHSPKVDCLLVASKQQLMVHLIICMAIFFGVLWQSHIFLITVCVVLLLLLHCCWLVASFSVYRTKNCQFRCEHADFVVDVAFQKSAITVQRVFMTPWFCVFLGSGRQRWVLWYDQLHAQKKWALFKQLQYWRQMTSEVNKKRI